MIALWVVSVLCFLGCMVVSYVVVEGVKVVWKWANVRKCSECRRDFKAHSGQVRDCLTRF